MHHGASRGFGLQHIWKEHEDVITQRGYHEDDYIILTARYVADILKSGAKIYCEFAGHIKERVIVLKSSVGLVIVEHRNDENNNAIYSVVTAYKQKNPHGVLIGKLK